jgi:hypothetical protein
MRHSRHELLKAFATAIANAALDFIEDAAEDAMGDLDPVEFDGDEDFAEPMMSDEDEQAATALDIANMTSAILASRLRSASSWAALRELYPRSPNL